MTNQPNFPRPASPQGKPDQDAVPVEQWPNRKAVVDGILSGEEVSQDPDLFADDDDDPELEMED